MTKSEALQVIAELLLKTVDGKPVPNVHFDITMETLLKTVDGKPVPNVHFDITMEIGLSLSPEECQSLADAFGTLAMCPLSLDTTKALQLSDAFDAFKLRRIGGILCRPPVRRIGR